MHDMKAILKIRVVSDLAPERQLFIRKEQFYRNTSFDGIYSMLEG